MSVLIAISGATASGKSTFSATLCELLGQWSPVLLNQDRYFRDYLDVPESDRDQARSSNHPSAVLWEDLVSHLEALKNGEVIEVPVPGTRARLRGDERVQLGPSELVIVEGHLLFNEQRIVDLADMLLFIDANVHERAVRRLLRDTDSGKTSLDQATRWYRKDVIPNVGEYSEATWDLADVIVPYDGENRVAAEAARDWVALRLG